MADYLDIGYFTETRNGKKRFVKLGYASPKNDGSGHFLNFDPHLFPGLDVMTLPQRERTDGQSGASSGPNDYARQTRDAGAPDLDDAVPF